jgi:hypothetical protein
MRPPIVEVEPEVLPKEKPEYYMASTFSRNIERCAAGTLKGAKRQASIRYKEEGHAVKLTIFRGNGITEARDVVAVKHGTAKWENYGYPRASDIIV